MELLLAYRYTEVTIYFQKTLYIILPRIFEDFRIPINNTMSIAPAAKPAARRKTAKKLSIIDTPIK